MLQLIRKLNIIQMFKKNIIWNIITTITVNRWLFCTNIKQSYYNKKQFLKWLEIKLLATVKHVYRKKSIIIVLDNYSTHVDSQVEQIIKIHNHFIYYLSSYFSDYNSIELIFSVFKIWIWWNYYFIWSAYTNFDEFLNSVIEFSHYDWFAHE